MDSLHTPDSSIPNNIRFFLNYLFAEQLAEAVPTCTSVLLPDFSVPVAQQDNSVDCGVYMLGNVKKLLLMSDSFEIRCDYQDASSVRKAFQPLHLDGSEGKLLRRQIAGAIDGLTRVIGKDEFEEEEDDSIEEVEVLEKAKTPEKRPVPPRRLSSSNTHGMVAKQLPVTAYLHTSHEEYQKSFDQLMGDLNKDEKKDPLTELRNHTSNRKRLMVVQKLKKINGIDDFTGGTRTAGTVNVAVTDEKKPRVEKAEKKPMREKKWKMNGNYMPINRLWCVCCNKERKGTVRPTPSPAGGSRAARTGSPPSAAFLLPLGTAPHCAEPVRTAG